MHAKRVRCEGVVAAAVDPFGRLSDDINKSIFGILSVGDIVRCRRVCKAWAQRPLDWHRVPVVDLSDYDPVQFHRIAPLLSNTTTLTIHGPWYGAAVALDACRRLVNFSVIGSANSVFANERDTVALFRLPNLSSISIHSANLSDNIVRTMLCVRSYGPWPLTTLDIPKVTLYDLTKLPGALVSLNVHVNLTGTRWLDLMATCPNLTCLTLNCHSSTMNAYDWKVPQRAWRHVRINGLTLDCPSMLAALSMFLQPAIRSFALDADIRDGLFLDPALWPALPDMPELTSFHVDDLPVQSAQHDVVARICMSKMPNLQFWGGQDPRHRFNPLRVSDIVFIEALRHQWPVAYCAGGTFPPLGLRLLDSDSRLLAALDQDPTLLPSSVDNIYAVVSNRSTWPWNGSEWSVFLLQQPRTRFECLAVHLNLCVDDKQPLMDSAVAHILQSPRLHTLRLEACMEPWTSTTIQRLSTHPTLKDVTLAPLNMVVEFNTGTLLKAVTRDQLTSLFHSPTLHSFRCEWVCIHHLTSADWVAILASRTLKQWSISIDHVSLHRVPLSDIRIQQHENFASISTLSSAHH
jgi:hypothetical protein